MGSITVKVPKQMGPVIRRVRIAEDGKTAALEKFIALALADKLKFSQSNRYGADDDVSCTVKMDKAEYRDTVEYRTTYDLVSKKDFLRHALIHGCSLFEDQEAAAKATKGQQP